MLHNVSDAELVLYFHNRNSHSLIFTAEHLQVTPLPGAHFARGVFLAVADAYMVLSTDAEALESASSHRHVIVVGETFGKKDITTPRTSSHLRCFTPRILIMLNAKTRREIREQKPVKSVQ